MQSLIYLAAVVGLFVFCFFFSHQIFKGLAKLTTVLSKKVGVYSKDKEFAIQRYVFLHRTSITSKAYNWINEQVISLGLKRYGVTPVGFLFFWSILNIPLTFAITVLMSFGMANFIWLYIVLLAIILVFTRVYVAERMQKREADIMNCEDLVIPEIVNNGVKMAIVKYIENFAPSIRPDFVSFLANMNDRGYSFADAMIILSDNLGSVFKDFAQKAIYYENLGERDLIDIFTDIVETNRLRRKLRYENDIAFGKLKTSFAVSSFMTAGYGFFVITTDPVSGHFFLGTTIGKMLLVFMILVVISVLGYITTIKSNAI